jgi:hypothetical protein
MKKKTLVTPATHAGLRSVLEGNGFFTIEKVLSITYLVTWSTSHLLDFVESFL